MLCHSPIPFQLYPNTVGKGKHIPCHLLLQSGNTGHIEHHPKEKQRLIGKFVQLLLQRLFQFNPAVLLVLAEKPETEVVSLDRETHECQFTFASCITHTMAQMQIRTDGIVYFFQYAISEYFLFLLPLFVGHFEDNDKLIL